MKKAIVGAGGFGRELRALLLSNNPDEIIHFFVDDQYLGKGCLPLSSLDVNEYEVCIAIGDPVLRQRLVSRLPSDTRYFTAVHKSAQILDPDTTRIGVGAVICSNAVITTGVTIGNHVHLNLLATVGHDVVIGDFCTVAPGGKVSGNCNLGNRVYVGTNASIREKVSVTADVTIGSGASVVKDIWSQGVYVGVPARKK